MPCPRRSIRPASVRRILNARACGREVTTAAEAESAVSELASSNVDIVKLVLDGGSPRL